MIYLEGRQEPFKYSVERIRLVGKWIQYLRSIDIDKTGRGFYFPRTGKVESVHGTTIFFECGNTVSASDLVEVVILREAE